MLKVSPVMLALFCAGIVFCTHVSRAHEDFEITSTARLQHNRLEVESVMTLHAAGSLLEESRDPEFELIPDNFELLRNRLQTAAMGLYEITAGGVPLNPLQTSVDVPEPGHLRFTVIYPQPASWPLKFRSGKVGGKLPNGVSDLGVYDQGEKLLGTTVLTLHSAASELSVDPASPISSSPATKLPATKLPVSVAPEPSPVAPAKVFPAPESLSWLGIIFGLGLGLGLGTLIFAALFRKDKPPPTI